DIIQKEYPEDLYVKQFSLYIDNIVKRIDLQNEAYGKEKNVPQQLFKVMDEQKKGLIEFKKTYGPVVTPSQLEESGSEPS
ncbi:MAG: phosphoenolpyruvate carboxykinase, partial [Pseudomonadota bacterium]